MLVARHAHTNSRLTLVRSTDGLGSIAHAPAPPLLRDSDQPFVLELNARTSAFRLEFSDTESPENWRCLRPDLVVLCYDISSRPSLVSLQTKVRRPCPALYPASTLTAASG